MFNQSYKLLRLTRVPFGTERYPLRRVSFVLFLYWRLYGRFRVDHYAAQFRKFKPKSIVHLFGHAMDFGN